MLSCAFALIAAFGTACDDGDDGDTQAENGTDAETSGDGDTSDNCESDGSVYGDQSECTEYVTCVETNCQTSYETCFGPNYLSGTFGGTCADYMACNNACDCGDTDCATECYNTHASMGTPCGDCLLNDIGVCVSTNCLDAVQSCA